MTDLAGDLRLVGRLLEASNATFFVEVVSGDSARHAVYKPVAGEQPLWDFPDNTLGLREVAAAHLSTHAGFGVVPDTIWVDDGPLGPGMVQRWVDHDAEAVVDIVASDTLPRAGWFEIFEGRDDNERAVSVIHADLDELRTMALFDAVINNSDRKGGHILPSATGIYGVDHGVSFHSEPKLRTILWGWSGTALRPADVAVLNQARDVVNDLDDYLTTSEVDATGERIDQLLSSERFPTPHRQRPALPWPAW